MKHISLKIKDEDTGIIADITPTTISISGSKTKASGMFNPRINDQSKYFVFQNSTPDTVELMANAFLRVVAEQKKLKVKDFE